MNVLDPAIFSEAFSAADSESAAQSLRRLTVSPKLHALQSAVERALQGNRPAVRIYVSAYRCLTREALQAAHARFPDQVVQTDDRLTLVDAEGIPSLVVLTLLDEGAIQAPFSPWVSAFGVSTGMVLDVISRLRQTVRSAEPFYVPAGRSALPHWDVDEAAIQAFVRLVRRELSAEAPELETIAETFGLNDTDMGELFGVRRQAVAQWKTDGVPTARAEKIATVASIADLLSRKLKAERLPGIARRPAEAYGGHTMLDLITADRHQELLSSVRESFAFSTTA